MLTLNKLNFNELMQTEPKVTGSERTTLTSKIRKTCYYQVGMVTLLYFKNKMLIIRSYSDQRTSFVYKTTLMTKSFDKFNVI